MDEQFQQPPYTQHLVRRPPYHTVGLDLEPSLDDQGIGFFLSHYVQKPTIIDRGQLDFLPELLAGPDSSELLKICAIATGLAGLAIATKSQSVMVRAREQYGTALRLTSKALQHATTSTADSTLVAVLMLAGYEHIQFEGHSINSWGKHFRAAAALVSLRGKEQLQRDLGRRIFQQVHATLLMVSSDSTTSLLHRDTQRWERYMREECRAFGEWWVYELVHRMRRAIHFLNHHGKNCDPVKLIQRALECDRDLDQLQKWVPDAFAYHTIHLPESMNQPFGDRYHVYPDPWIAQNWNHMRSIRIELQRTIVSQVEKAKGGMTGQVKPENLSSYLAASKQVMLACSEAIFASTPQVIGQVPFPDTAHSAEILTKTLRGSPYPEAPITNLKPPGTFFRSPTSMYHHVWPLYLAGVSQEGSNKRTKWAIEILHFLARKLGTRQAIAVAEDLEGSVERGSASVSSQWAAELSNSYNLLVPDMESLQALFDQQDIEYCSMMGNSRITTVSPH